jgi:hypothetical protein
METALARKAQAFPIFKTIPLGLQKNADEYREALLKTGHRVSDWADDMLGKLPFCTKRGSLTDLVVVTVTELGLSETGQYKDICARSLEMGFQLCPAEVGPALRLVYQDQPEGEWLNIAMECSLAPAGTAASSQ